MKEFLFFLLCTPKADNRERIANGRDRNNRKEKERLEDPSMGLIFHSSFSYPLFAILSVVLSSAACQD